MDDGFFVPGNHDGMAAFEGGDGKVLIVRNHELKADRPNVGPFGDQNRLLSRLDRRFFYDYGKGEAPPLGGTTTLVYDVRSQKLERHWLSLTGTMVNCAGGPTPWGSWISCEENTQRAGGNFEEDHGYVFDVPIAAQHPIEPVPLRALGRFKHEAAGVDPGTGIIYETEDLKNGLFYRFIPDRRGDPHSPGRLQALRFRDTPSLETFNSGTVRVPKRQGFAVAWVDLDNVESPGDDLRDQGFAKGAARFNRGEGIWFGEGVLYFTATHGGAKERGQIWRYGPSPVEGTPEEDRRPARIELFAEPDSADLLDCADNITIAPWGDLVVCEDGGGVDRVVGITPDGRLYEFARNALNDAEFAGATFSPDGTTLFVNIYTPGLTLAITGPWTSRRG